MITVVVMVTAIADIWLFQKHLNKYGFKQFKVIEYLHRFCAVSLFMSFYIIFKLKNLFAITCLIRD